MNLIWLPSRENTIEIDKLLRTGKLTLNFDNITYSNAKNVVIQI